LNEIQKNIADKLASARKITNHKPPDFIRKKQQQKSDNKIGVMAGVKGDDTSNDSSPDFYDLDYKPPTDINTPYPGMI
jgi:hypothetical protein